MLTIIIIAFLSPSGAHAENTWQDIVNELRSSGISRIGNLDFSEFDKQIEFDQIDGAPASVESGSRQSATNKCGRKEIKISKQLPPEAMSSLAHLQLHEVLGRLCHDDHDYAPSTALIVLAKMKESPQRRALLEGYSKTIFRRKMAEGGTSVSGGGDLATLFIKDRVLQQIMGDDQNRSGATQEFLLKYPSIDFEPLQKSSNLVYIQYDFLISTRKESITVLLPMKRWKAGEESRQQLIRETARKVMEIFPAYSGVRLRRFVPSSCAPGSPAVTYPYSTDDAVKQIQDTRAGLHMGCEQIFPGQVSMGTTAPGLNKDDEPKASGNYYFTCEFTYGSARFVNQTVSMAGRPQNNSIAWGIDPNDYLDGSIFITADGKIAGTLISYHPPGGDFVRSPLVRSGAAQLVIKGMPLIFSCRKER